MTKWHCSRICIKLVISTKNFFLSSLCLWSERLSLVTCKQRADHFTAMVWFDFIKWRFHFIRRRFHYSECIKYCQKHMIQNRISSETYNWYVCATWEIEPQNLGFTQMISLGGVEGQNILLILAPIWFLWNNLWSVCRYITGPISDCSSQWSPIHISHGFAFKLHILQKSDNLLYYEIVFRRCDKLDSVQFMKSLRNIVDAGLSEVQLNIRWNVDLVQFG